MSQQRAAVMADTRWDESRSYVRFLVVELLVSGGVAGAIGALVGMLASLLQEAQIVIPLVLLGASSGLVTGVIAVMTGREILPRLSTYSLPLRAAVMVLLLTGCAFAVAAIGFFFYPRFYLHMGRSVAIVGSINGLIAIVVGTSVFVFEDLSRRLARTREILAAERVAQVQARERAARAELQALQARINPHFFFNALNTAAAFVTEDPQRAEALLEKFSDLFRYAFRRGGEPVVPLGEEMEFIADFIEIERARFGDRLRCALEVDPELTAFPVPPLLLQPLVENAVLHGRDPETGEGDIVVRARQEDGQVIVEVQDRGPGPGQAVESFPHGHALENISARVAATGGGRLEIRAAENGAGTLARVVFPNDGRSLKNRPRTGGRSR